MITSPNPGLVPPPESLMQIPMIVAGAVMLGLSAGLARERSGSVLAAIFVHGVAATTVALVALYS
jgi:membrane protease YdiL (CAAX protease family)